MLSNSPSILIDARRAGLFALALIVAWIAIAVSAGATVMLTPRRLVLTDEQPSGVFRVINTSDRTDTFVVKWTQYRMNPQGALLAVVDEEARGAASDLVRVSPSRVTLAPGESQSIRVRTRLPAGLPEGEYISHLGFEPTGANREDNGSGGGLQLQMNMRLSISAPVIVRRGDLQAAATVQAIGIDDENGLINVKLTRTGSASVYGDLEAYYGQPGARGVLISQTKGVAVYPNLSETVRDMPIKPPAGVQLGRAFCRSCLKIRKRRISWRSRP